MIKFIISEQPNSVTIGNLSHGIRTGGLEFKPYSPLYFPLFKFKNKRVKNPTFWVPFIKEKYGPYTRESVRIIVK